MRLTSKPLGLVLLGIFFCGIAVSAAFGWWQTESTKVPVKISEGDFAGEYNPADIRGSYTFGEVSELFAVPLVDLQEAFLLPEENAGAVAMKDLETTFAEAAENNMEVGTSSVRLFVSYYKGLPYEESEEYLPAPAAKILRKLGILTDERLAFLETHTISLAELGIESNESEDQITESNQPVPTIENSDQIIEPTPPVLEHIDTDTTIKGKTTFREVLDWGVSQSKIEEILGQSMPNPLTLIKDFCLEQGLEFGTIKDGLQLEIDQLQ